MSKAVVFDFDGPIFDGRQIAQTALTDTWQNFVFLKASRAPELTGTPLYGPAQMIAVFTAPLGLTQKQINEAKQYYSERLANHESHAAINSDINRALRKAREVGLKLAVLSNRKTDNLKRLLVELGIHTLFHFVAGSDRTTEPKPSPEALRRCAGELGISILDLVFIGDSDSDFTCAESAGVKFYHAGYSGEPASKWHTAQSRELKKQTDLNTVIDPVRRQEKFSVNSLPSDVEDALVQNKLIVLAGAGVSIGSGYGDWNTEYAPALRSLGASTLTDTRDLIDALQLVASESTKAQSVLTTFQKMFERKNDRQPNAYHYSILRVAPPRIWTTNYDSLFETAINQGALDTRIIHDDPELLQAVFNSNVLLKLNGDFEHLKLEENASSLNWNVVLTQEQFDLAEQRRREMWSLFERDFRENCILFVGASINDPVLRRVLSIARRRVPVTRYPHFTFAKRLTDPLAEHEQALAALSLARSNVQTIWADDYKQIPTFCARVALQKQHPIVGFSGTVAGEDESRMLEGATLTVRDIGRITQTLGRMFAARDFRVTSGCGPWVGREAVDAAFEVRPNGARYYLRKGGGTTYRTKATAVVCDGNSYGEMRVQFISELTVLIAIAGESRTTQAESGTDSEIRLAMSRGIPVVLIPQGGGAVAKFSSKLVNLAATAYDDHELRSMVITLNSKIASLSLFDLHEFVSGAFCDEVTSLVLRAMASPFAGAGKSNFMSSVKTW